MKTMYNINKTPVNIPLLKADSYHSNIKVLSQTVPGEETLELSQVIANLDNDVEVYIDEINDAANTTVKEMEDYLLNHSVLNLYDFESGYVVVRIIYIAL